MAGLTKEQRAEREAAQAAEQVNDGLIEMNKDGQALRVHPTCVKSHQAAGWKVTV